MRYFANESAGFFHIVDESFTKIQSLCGKKYTEKFVLQESEAGVEDICPHCVSELEKAKNRRQMS